MLNRKKANNEPIPENEPIEETVEAEETAEAVQPDAEAAETVDEAVEEEVNPLEEELAKAKDSYLRLAAEYDNFRKRTQREKEALASEVKASTVAQLLPVIDNIERALSFDDADESDIRKGIEMVRNQAVTIFDKLGIVPFCEVGDVFDPNLHNCIGMAAVDGFESGQITMVIQKGYQLGDKVIRPAMVQVAE